MPDETKQDIIIIKQNIFKLFTPNFKQKFLRKSFLNNVVINKIKNKKIRHDNNIIGTKLLRKILMTL